jgi:hypothetical protein
MSTKFNTILIVMLFSGSISFSQKAVTRLPVDSLYKNKSGKTMWVLTDVALDTFTVNMIHNKYCQRISDSLQVLVNLGKERNHLCDSALTIRSKEALMWHNKLDSNDKKLQKSEIDLSKANASKKKWRTGAFISMGAAAVFLGLTILFVVK